MSRAAGPAAWTPNPPCAISTTTTYLGLFAGAQEAYHEWSLRPAPASAVPVLPATGTGKFAKSDAEVPAGDRVARVGGDPLLLDDVRDLAAGRAVDADARVQAEQ